VREDKAVQVLTDLTNELAGWIELEESRRAARECAPCTERRRRIAGARVDVDVALGIGGHADRFTEIQVVGKLDWIDGIEGDLGNGQLRRHGHAEEYD